MKALFIGHDPEEDKSIVKLMTNNFPKIAMLHLSDTSNILQVLTEDGPFSFVIISIDNKNISTSEIYGQINDTLGIRPFIFIGSPNSVKFQLNNEMIHNASNVLIELPLTLEEFKKAILLATDWIKKEEFEESILEFSRDDLHPMRLRNFYLFDQVPYDVYIELTSIKFGKIISKNKLYNHQMVRNYSKKNIKYFYLRKDEHLEFLSISIKNLLKIYEIRLSDRKKLITLHLKTAFFIHQFIKAASVSDEINKLTRYFIDSVSDLIHHGPGLGPLLNNVTDSSSITFAEKSVMTAYVCETILINMGWSADMSRGKLILAALIQDISLDNDDLIKIRSINDPNLKMFSEEVQDAFKWHPQKAAQLSNYFSGFSDVDFILLEQHEHPTGSGFPKGLNSSGLTTISCLFILASNFVSIVSQATKSPTLYRETIAGMKRIYSKGNFKDPFHALEKAFKK